MPGLSLQFQLEVLPNRPWITGDSVWGGFHSNQFIVVDGDPVFFGKVTTLKGIKEGTVRSRIFGWVSKMELKLIGLAACIILIMQRLQVLGPILIKIYG